MKKTLCFFVFVVCAMLSAGSAYACSCRRGITPEQYFANASVVFIGEFQESRRSYNHFATTNAVFKVRKVLKGEIKIGDSVTISTGYQGAMCGISDWVNEAPKAVWIIYATWVTTNTVPATTILATSICDGTSPIWAHRLSMRPLVYFRAPVLFR